MAPTSCQRHLCLVLAWSCCRIKRILVGLQGEARMHKHAMLGLACALGVAFCSPGALAGGWDYGANYAPPPPYAYAPPAYYVPPPVVYYPPPVYSYYYAPLPYAYYRPHYYWPGYGYRHRPWTYGGYGRHWRGW